MKIRFWFPWLWEHFLKQEASQEVLEARSPDSVIPPPLSELRHCEAWRASRWFADGETLTFRVLSCLLICRGKDLDRPLSEACSGFRFTDCRCRLCVLCSCSFLQVRIKHCHFTIPCSNYSRSSQGFALFSLCACLCCMCIHTCVLTHAVCTGRTWSWYSIYSAVTLHLICETVFYGDSTACPVTCRYLSLSSPT